MAVTGWLTAPLDGRFSVGITGLAMGAVGLELLQDEKSTDKKIKTKLIIPRPFIKISPFKRV